MNERHERMSRRSRLGFLIGSLLIPSPLVGIASAAEPQCTIVEERAFAPGGENVRLARQKGLSGDANFGLFNAPLAVNTDGAPTSYHPEDFRGQSLAINRIDNGIAIRSTVGKKLSVGEKIKVFDQWRKSGSWKVPAGYKITWQNVIAATEDGKPCIFSSGAYKGYFGSLTALKNGLKSSLRGECEVNNQLDQRFIPAIVLRGNNNPLRKYKAATGDLVLAFNPTNGVLVPAIIGDTGDGKRIGEGSIALNMALKKKKKQPKNYTEALQLDTGSQDIIVAVLPESRSYKRKRPYTAENISERVAAWAKEHGYGSTAAMAKAMIACAKGL